MSGRLEGKTAVVTGAGQGIGRVTALAFAHEGASVVAIDRNADRIADLPVLAAAIRPVVLDVTDAGAVRGAIEAAGPLDILFNCAGRVHVGTIFETSDAQWAASFDVNVTSMFHTMKAALPAMVGAGRGSIINMASVVSSIAGAPNRAAYGASKAAVIGLTKAVAADVISTGVRVNAVCPGTTQSPSLDARIAATGDPVAGRQMFIARQPMGRLGRPQEIAAAVVWLASDESQFATGTTIVIDGGQTL